MACAGHFYVTPLALALFAHALPTFTHLTLRPVVHATVCLGAVLDICAAIALQTTHGSTTLKDHKQGICLHALWACPSDSGVCLSMSVKSTSLGTIRAPGCHAPMYKLESVSAISDQICCLATCVHDGKAGYFANSKGQGDRAEC